MISFSCLGSFEVLIINRLPRAHCMSWTLMDSWISQVHTCQRPWHYEMELAWALIAFCWWELYFLTDSCGPIWMGGSTVGFWGLFSSMFPDPEDCQLPISINKCTYVYYSKYFYILFLFSLIAKLYSELIKFFKVVSKIEHKHWWAIVGNQRIRARVIL